MPGASAHGQHNKGHKAGRRAGASARQKHRTKKDVMDGGGRVGVKATRHQGKAERAAAAKSARDAHRAALLERRRAALPPKVIALMPLSSGLAVQRMWDLLLSQCKAGVDKTKATAKDEDKDAMEDADGNETFPLVPTTLALPGRARARFTFLPPPVDRSDPLAVIEIGRAADVLLLGLPGDVSRNAGGGGGGSACGAAPTVDAEGVNALRVLNALGMPGIVAGAQGRPTAGSLKERSAWRKVAGASLGAVVAGDHKVVNLDTADDAAQLLRHADAAEVSHPGWRTQRPAVLVEGGDYVPNASGPGGTLQLTGYVRGAGLSANALVHVPGVGDAALLGIAAASEPVPASGGGRRNDMEGMEEGGTGAMLASPDAEAETLDRENVPEAPEGEQTWPTAEEMAEAEAANKKRRLPKGTSEYQAAWILDEDYSDLESEDGGDGDDAEKADAAMSGDEGDEAAADVEVADDGATDAMGGDDADDMSEGEYEAHYAAARRERKAAEDDDVEFPDEMDVPFDKPARERFAKYRGLKSFRSSPWDPKEELPSDYARVFAFKNWQRARKHALATAAKAGGTYDTTGVAAGTYVTLHIKDVSPESAARVGARVNAAQVGAAAPLSVYGLMTNEAKMSVVNFAMKKVPEYSEPVANKEKLLFCTGVRMFEAAPILSVDDHRGNKFKMERFLHAGAFTCASIYAPIMYTPLPLLAFKPATHGLGGALQPPQLAATGSLRSCDPDRINLKKIVLTGYPVKVHKKKAMVKYMFHNPDDVRWFKPCELWTKYGRRGRVLQPVGTHGAMKCAFDAPVQQRDTICIALYKRVYPKWPADMRFAI